MRGLLLLAVLSAAAAAVCADGDACTSAAFPPECRDFASLAAADDLDAFAASDAPRWAAARAAGEWNGTVAHPETDTRRCTVPREDAAGLSRARFDAQYLERSPVIIRGATDASDFARMTRKTLLVYCFGGFPVTLSTANQHSYAKQDVPFGRYVAGFAPQRLDVSGAKSQLLFGDHDHAAWAPLFDHYRKPLAFIDTRYHSLSFGVAPSGTGVPFHTHGHVFAEVTHGRKRWFLAEPGQKPTYSGEATTLSWVLSEAGVVATETGAVWDCVADVGDMIYIPTHWHHATLNLGEAVFMSDFV
jgi:ribosomal protein L16 Arg81 hydroxylase